jgi:hypothetical protein
MMKVLHMFLLYALENRLPLVAFQRWWSLGNEVSLNHIVSSKDS